jgi:DNA primase
LLVATISAPIGWKEIEKGITIEDFRLENMRSRIAKVGDLFEALLAAKGRFDLQDLQ